MKLIYFGKNKKFSLSLDFLFNFGIIFLPTIPSISAIFLFIASFKVFKDKSKKFSLDKYDFYLIFVSILLTISCIQKTIFWESNLEGWSPTLSWIGLFNFLPFFWVFYTFQGYLDSVKARLNAAKLLIIGTIPLLISVCINALGFSGDFVFLGGLVGWYFKKESLGGTFNNVNYLACYLNMIWPFAYLLFSQNTKNKIKKIFLGLLSLAILISIIATYSRSGWLNLGISIPLLNGFNFFKFYFPLIIIYSFLAFYQFYFPGNFPFLNFLLMPERFISRFYSFPRLELWSNALLFISEKPFLGWGAATFPLLYEINQGKYNSHSHNLFLEIAVNYGSIISLLLLFLFIFLLIINFINVLKKRAKKNNLDTLHNNLDKAWFVSGVVFIISHLLDVQYYDIRISLLGWFIFSGIRVINKEQK